MKCTAQRDPSSCPYEKTHAFHCALMVDHTTWAVYAGLVTESLFTTRPLFQITLHIDVTPSHESGQLFHNLCRTSCNPNITSSHHGCRVTFEPQINNHNVINCSNHPSVAHRRSSRQNYYLRDPNETRTHPNLGHHRVLRWTIYQPRDKNRLF